MTKTAEASIQQYEDGWEYVCPRPTCQWSSSGWATEELAKERKVAHETEHKTGEPATEMAESETYAKQLQTVAIAEARAAAERTQSAKVNPDQADQAPPAEKMDKLAEMEAMVPVAARQVLDISEVDTQALSRESATAAGKNVSAPPEQQTPANREGVPRPSDRKPKNAPTGALRPDERN